MTDFADMPAPSPLFRVHEYEYRGKTHIHYWFWCPGCEEGHAFDERWQFDGNFDCPTFSPSLLVETPLRSHTKRCHSFVRAGKMEFLADCTHAKAGQTVALVPWPD